MRSYILLLIAIFAATLVACTPRDKWTCVVYPDRKNLADALQIGTFDSLQECGIAAVKTLDRLHALERRRGDYECGRNCRKESTSPSLLNCEETMKANIPVDIARALYPRDSISQALEKMFLHEIHGSYNPEYLTYPGMLKAWVGMKAISFKVPISKKLTLFAEKQAKFADNVACLGMVSDSVVPTIEMSPTEFEVYFNGLAKGKGLGLKLSK